MQMKCKSIDRSILSHLSHASLDEILLHTPSAPSRSHPQDPYGWGGGLGLNLIFKSVFGFGASAGGEADGGGAAGAAAIEPFAGLDAGGAPVGNGLRAGFAAAPTLGLRDRKSVV